MYPSIFLDISSDATKEILYISKYELQIFVFAPIVLYIRLNIMIQSVCCWKVVAASSFDVYVNSKSTSMFNP
jgi:hypothetical protein